MKKISTALPVSKMHSRVATYINLQLQAIAPKTMAEVADEAGLPQRNLLSMIRTGTTKLPFERIPGIANALKVDQGHLFRLALEEYQPHINALLNEEGKKLVSKQEQELLVQWRMATNDTDPPIAPVALEVSELGGAGAPDEPAAARTQPIKPITEKRICYISVD